MTGDDLHRTGFHSLRGGFNWDHLPLRLFAKGNVKFWNPADIDFSQDARDWAELTDAQRANATYLVAMFVAGEEAVTEDIQPFMRAMAAEGRIGDEMYLTQFAFEEARHTEVFRRWMDAVGLTEDLHSYVADNPATARSSTRSCRRRCADSSTITGRRRRSGPASPTTTSSRARSR